jgi:hypothetical protein
MIILGFILASAQVLPLALSMKQSYQLDLIVPDFHPSWEEVDIPHSQFAQAAYLPGSIPRSIPELDYFP